MKVAYIDTSAVVAILLNEPQGIFMQKELPRFSEVFSSPLLEAELKSLLSREQLSPDLGNSLLDIITWAYHHRPLSEEIGKVLSTYYLRGADLYHLATALYLFPDPKKVAFLSLDSTQLKAARSCGFFTPM